MKKIIMGMAAVAMAASMFAMDFTGGVKIDNSLFNKDLEAANAKAKVLSAGDGSGGGNWWGTRAQTAFYGDKGSAQFAISTNWSGAVKFNSISISFNPVDMVKVQVLEAGDKLNESFVDQKKIIDVGGAWGVTLTPVDGLSIGAVLANDWIEGDAVKDTGVKVAYTADFGTIGAMMVAKNTFKTLSFGAGYANTFDSVAMFADVVLNMADSKLTSVAIDEQVVLSADAFKLSEYVAYTMDVSEANKGKAGKDTLLLRAKAEYALDNCTPYLSISSDDLLVGGKAKGGLVDEELSMVINPGVAFNIGCVSCDAGVKFTLKGANTLGGNDEATKNNITSFTNKIDIPFSVSVGF